MNLNTVVDKDIKGLFLFVQIGLLAVCINLSVFIKEFVFVTFGITCLTILLDKNSYVFCQLFFLLPFTVIYKVSPDSSSLFAFLLPLFALSIIVRRKVKLYAIIPIAIYMLIGLLSSPIIWIKLVSGWVLLLFFIKIANTNLVKHASICLSLGLIISSSLGLVKDSIPQLAIYLTDANSEYMLGERISRFSGLYYDPNYFSVTIIMALYMILFFGASGGLDKRIAFPIAGILLYFGSLSYSRLFVLAAILVIISQIPVLIRSSRYKIATIVILLLGIVLVLPLLLSSTYWAYFSDRMQTGDISNGRLQLASSYLNYIFSNIDVLFWGKGLDGELYGSHGPHNTFIESLYFLGLFGSLIYVITLYKVFKSNRNITTRSTRNYTLLIIFCIMIGTLGMITMNDFMFYFMLVWYSLNIDYKANVQ